MPAIENNQGSTLLSDKLWHGSVYRAALAAVSSVAAVACHTVSGYLSLWRLLSRTTGQLKHLHRDAGEGIPTAREHGAASELLDENGVVICRDSEC
jgi:hypothetical protein